MAALVGPACDSHRCHGLPPMNHRDDPLSAETADMSSDVKPSSPEPTLKHRQQGIKIFMWPKVIFLYPTAIVSLICGIGMLINDDRVHDPTRPLSQALAKTQYTAKGKAGDNHAAAAQTKVESSPAAETQQPDKSVDEAATTLDKLDRFWTTQNLLGLLFLAMLAFNLLTMGLDMPRFTIVAVLFGILFLVFFLLWLGSYFQLNLMRPIHAIMSHIYAVAISGFYFMVFVTLMFVFVIIWLTRWLDYWEILPNEILHHHGPLSDLERYPTMNLKFDKEIPDILEYMLLGAGRLVLHIPNVSKAMVLDNVLFINRKEEALKRVMSRLEVRITTDQEAGEAVI
jgi:hypothetical protein